MPSAVVVSVDERLQYRECGKCIVISSSKALLNVVARAAVVLSIFCKGLIYVLYALSVHQQLNRNSTVGEIVVSSSSLMVNPCCDKDLCSLIRVRRRLGARNSSLGPKRMLVYPSSLFRCTKLRRRNFVLHVDWDAYFVSSMILRRKHPTSIPPSLVPGDVLPIPVAGKCFW